MIKNKCSQKRIYVSKNVRKACVGKNVLDKKRKSCNTTPLFSCEDPDFTRYIHENECRRRSHSLDKDRNEGVMVRRSAEERPKEEEWGYRVEERESCSKRVRLSEYCRETRVEGERLKWSR